MITWPTVAHLIIQQQLVGTIVSANDGHSAITVCGIIDSHLGKRYGRLPKSLDKRCLKLEFLPPPVQLPKTQPEQHRQQQQGDESRSPTRPKEPVTELQLHGIPHRELDSSRWLGFEYTGGPTINHRNPSMLIKTIVILMLLLILASLGSGLFFLIRDQGRNPRTVRALTVRIALSVTLFVLLMLAYATGLLTPHGL